MDKDDLKYQFEKKRHELINNRNFTSVFFLGMPTLLVGTIILGSIAVPSPDYKVKNEEVVSEFRQRFNKLGNSSETSINAVNDSKKKYVHDLILSEDISEVQFSKFEKEFINKFGDIEELTGINIGQPGDLRECRAEVGNSNAEKIAECTVDKSMDEIYILSTGIFLASLQFMLLFLMGMDSKGTGKENIIRWMNDKPKNPRFRH